MSVHVATLPAYRFVVGLVVTGTNYNCDTFPVLLVIYIFVSLHYHMLFLLKLC